MNNTVLIDPTPPEGDQQRVDAIFTGIEKALGFVPDGLKLYGVSPPLLESFVGAIGYFKGQERLGQELLAMIRYVTSSRNECSFCIGFNEAILLQLGKELDDIHATRDDLDKAPLAQNEKALLQLALDSLESPETIDRSRIEQAKSMGWDERDIFDAVYVAANNRAFTTLLKTFNVDHQGSLG